MKERVYLVIRADRSVRVVRRQHAIRADEIAIPITLTFPDGWGRVSSTRLEVTVPDYAPTVEVADESRG